MKYKYFKFVLIMIISLSYSESKVLIFEPDKFDDKLERTLTKEYLEKFNESFKKEKNLNEPSEDLIDLVYKAYKALEVSCPDCKYRPNANLIFLTSKNGYTYCGEFVTKDILRSFVLVIDEAQSKNNILYTIFYLTNLVRITDTISMSILELVPLLFILPLSIKLLKNYEKKSMSNISYKYLYLFLSYGSYYMLINKLVLPFMCKKKLHAAHSLTSKMLIDSGYIQNLFDFMLDIKIAESPLDSIKHLMFLKYLTGSKTINIKDLINVIYKEIQKGEVDINSLFNNNCCSDLEKIQIKNYLNNLS